jgi:hypothetical protein
MNAANNFSYAAVLRMFSNIWPASPRVASKRRAPPRVMQRVAVAAITCTASVVVAGCKPTPEFGTLSIPNPAQAGTWGIVTAKPFEVLPTQDLAVRIYFRAPAQSRFRVSVRELDGTLTALPGVQGTPTPAAGGFQIISQNTNTTPAIYGMEVHAPTTLANPTNFDILVVNLKEPPNYLFNSANMVVALRARKIFTVSVEVQGDGHVTSTPAGITCGTSPSGRALTDCSRAFGPYTVNLAPGSNDSSVTKFQKWSGNCPSNVQVCSINLDGRAPVFAKAEFAPLTGGTPISACPAAPLIPGLRWIEMPQCSPSVGATTVALCDGAGYYCCDGGATVSGTRCFGGNEFLPDCMHRAPRGMLRQPGGCYEIAP